LWTTVGVRYRSPRCPVFVCRYSSFLTKRLVRLSIQSVCLTTASLLSWQLRCCLLGRSYKLEE